LIDKINFNLLQSIQILITIGARQTLAFGR